jgi:ABC-2 type transport system permease protein
VTSVTLATPHVGSGRAPAVLRFVACAAAVTGVEVRKLSRDPTELFSRAVQPILWLTVFGQVFARVKGIDVGEVGYLAFMTPGILAQSVLFSAIFYGIAVIWERDLGIVHKLLVSPASRVALVLGKSVAAGIRGLVQVVIVFAVAAVLGVRMRLDPLSIAGVLLVTLVGSAAFATFSLVVACLVKTRERFMGVGQLLTMPLFFASNAIYPISIMPGWLKAAAHANPLSYLVDALRALMIAGGRSTFGLPLDFAVLLGTLLALLLVAARLYPRLVT